MGTSLAILGSYVLAGELANNATPAEAFTAYEQKLRPFVEEIQKVPSFVPGIMHPQSNLGRRLLQAVFWTLSQVVKLPGLRNSNNRAFQEDFPIPKYPQFS